VGQDVRHWNWRCQVDGACGLPLGAVWRIVGIPPDFSLNIKGIQQAQEPG
jgi:hypothetical protein